MFGRKSRRIAELEATLRERERQEDLLRHDYDALRADYAAIVANVSNMATRPVSQTLFDADVYKEDDKQPDVFVSPPEDAPISFEDLMERLTETEGGKITGEGH